LTDSAVPPASGDALDITEFAQLVQGALMRYRSWPDGRAQLMYVSDGCEAIWGFTAPQILADEAIVWHCTEPVDRQLIRASFRAAGISRAPWSHEWRINSPSGGLRWLRGLGRCSAQPDGTLLWTVLIDDATHSVRARLQEQASRSQLSAVCDRLTDVAVQRFDRDMRINYWNQGSEKMYGHTAAEALGRDIIELVVPADLRRGTREKLQALAADGQTSLPYNTWFLRRDGRLAAVQGTAVVLRDADGNHEFVCVDVDPENLSRVEGERASLEAQLRESQKLEALGTLAGGVAHDFNNILAAILGNTRLALMDAQGQPEIVQSLEEIRRAAHRAKDLVQRILAFGRRQNTARKVVDMAEVVTEAVTLMGATAPGKLRLDVECDPQTSLVLADATQLQQVVINLCTNAMHAIAGRDRGRIHLRLSPHDGAPPAAGPGELSIVTDPMGWPDSNVCLTVEDNGCGMDPGTLARVFEPFFTTKPVGQGTGLGMPVVHGILRDHQGAISVRSTQGQGSVFRVYLRGVEGRERPVETDSSLMGLPAPGDVAGGTTILYVDDDELIARMVGRLLSRDGLSAHIYSSPQQALDDVRSGAVSYDLAVLDFAMPGLNGLELAQALRALHPDRPVAITSGFITAELSQRGPEAGVAELIPKPNTGSELIKAIRRLAGRVRQPDQGLNTD